ncbi:Rieske (2Fe-2S) protein [Ramlibacter sp. AN1133]|uniref:Rieske (2Fe-2S) protein n=1 Tax=Ramlibacter sp. AN1133 TaxID=3133429 RepID=UPI0030C147AD
MPEAVDEARIPLCNSADLVDGGLAVPFDVVYGGQTCRAFAIRWKGQVHAYLNRCSHVAMELDWQPDRFFDDTGRWLLCGTHGAVYQPDTGACAGGPCRGPLVPIALSEVEGVVHWHTAFNLQPVTF